MRLAFALDRLSLRRLMVGTALIAAGLPANAMANPQPSASLSAAPMDWIRDYTPAQFLQLPAGKAPIDPADFREPLLVAALFQETNRQRDDLQLPALLPDERASDAARSHARWMAHTHVLSHDEPSEQGKPLTSLDRLVQRGLSPHATAENIADSLLPNIAPGEPFYTRLVDGRPVYSHQSGGPPLRAHTYDELARIMLAQWMHSPLHRAHIVSPDFRFLGVGVAVSHRKGHLDVIYGAQEFFTPRVAPPLSAIRNGETTLLPR